MTYHKATICLNGHVLSAYEANFQKYCSKCGAETYSNCTNCHAPIRGLQDIQAAVIGKRTYVLDYYCHDCGAPYPWTQKILDNAIKLLSLDGDLDDTSKELIKMQSPNY